MNLSILKVHQMLSVFCLVFDSSEAFEKRTRRKKHENKDYIEMNILPSPGETFYMCFYS